MTGLAVVASAVTRWCATRSTSPSPISTRPCSRSRRTWWTWSTRRLAGTSSSPRQRATGRLHPAPLRSWRSRRSRRCRWTTWSATPRARSAGMFLKAIGNELRRRGRDRPVVAVVTQTVVADRRSGFAHPVKPVGTFMSGAGAPLPGRARLDHRRGRRRLAGGARSRRRSRAKSSSCRPSLRAVPPGRDRRRRRRRRRAGGARPTAAWPASRRWSTRTSHRRCCWLAQLDADLLAIPTGVDKVAVNFGQPGERWLDSADRRRGARLAREGWGLARAACGRRSIALAGFVTAGRRRRRHHLAREAARRAAAHDRHLDRRLRPLHAPPSTATVFGRPVFAGRRRCGAVLAHRARAAARSAASRPTRSPARSPARGFAYPGRWPRTWRSAR